MEKSRISATAIAKGGTALNPISSVIAVRSNRLSRFTAIATPRRKAAGAVTSRTKIISAMLLPSRSMTRPKAGTLESSELPKSPTAT
ncbi:MAG: hypothetical protein BGN95_09940 [Sphingomonas sp. 66-10]|nr:MAG: hypothetical protein BGN95_09940 [Sphingomonas sp. 66-10]